MKRKLKACLKMFFEITKKALRLFKPVLRKIIPYRVKKKIKEVRDCAKRDFFGGVWKKKSVLIAQPVSDIILMQLSHETFPEYVSYDLAVRCLSIEDYYGMNDYGFALYRKMHTNGGNYGDINLMATANPKEIDFYHGKVLREQHSIEQFETLIKSYETRGYDSSKAIDLDSLGLLMSGSHRTTLAYFLKQEFISTNVWRMLHSRRFSIRFFVEKGFTTKEIDLIKKKMELIRDDCLKRTGHFYVILFPPAEPYFDEIAEMIDTFEPQNIRIVEQKEYSADIEDFRGFLKIAYTFDSMPSDVFPRKFYYIRSATKMIRDKIHFRIIKLDIKDPRYRLKKDNGLPESMVTVRLKESLRKRIREYDERYTKQYAEGYSHGVIMHSTDNYISNNGIRILLGIDKSLSELFKRLEGFEIAIAESSTKFTNNFYFGKDLDIFVKCEDLEEIVRITAEFCRDHFISKETESWLTVDITDSDNGKRVWLKIMGTMLVMFDYKVDLLAQRTIYQKSYAEV